MSSALLPRETAVLGMAEAALASDINVGILHAAHGPQSPRGEPPQPQRHSILLQRWTWSWNHELPGTRAACWLLHVLTKEAASS